MTTIKITINLKADSSVASLHRVDVDGAKKKSILAITATIA
jgi:hypothetical protein